VTAGSGPHWWSDALNDPWRNPESDAIVRSTAPAPEPPPPPFEPAAPSVRPGSRVIVGVAVAVGLMAGALGGAVGYVAAVSRERPTTIGAGPHNLPPVSRPDGSIPAVVAEVMPSVVTVSGNTAHGGTLGSGFVISDAGYVLTNEHVITGITDQALRVTLSDNSAVPASVVGRDPESDLAVLKVDRENLTSVEFADSDSVVVGDGVVAIGSPLALPGTVTAGIVSALDRTIESHDAGGAQRYYAAIQTDAAVNQGSSGGPLFDFGGRVIGINSVIKSLVEDGQDAGNIGIAFAIPINHATRVATEIIDTGRARRTVIGAKVDEIRSGGGGARLTSVDVGGPAEAAGLRTGDVVVRIGTHLVEQPHDLIALVRRFDPGTTVTLTYRRGAETQTASVTLVADAN
jgi:putative serine protease PepD